MTSKTRVAWVLIPLGVGGGALTVLQTWASNIDLERFAPSVILGVDGHTEAMRAVDLGHLPVYTVPALSFKRGWLLPALVSLIRIMRAERFDIVHTMLVQGDILGVIAAKLIGFGVVVSSVVGCLYRGETPRAKKWIYRLFYRILHTHLDRIVAVSHMTRSALIRDFGVASEKVDVIHLGIDRRVFEHGELIPPPSFREPVVGTVAELIPEKGIDDFVDAATLIRVEAPRARFIIVGDGPERENLMKKVEAQGLADVVEFRGWIPSGLDLFEEVDGFVLSSYEEGLPWVVLEAMACRRPTVATNVGGIPEIITDGENGLLVQAGDPASIAAAVLSLINNPEWALEVGERGRQHVESRFSAYREMTEIEALYDQAMRARRCRK